MNLTMLTRRSLSLFAAVGGWRTLAEAVASRALFLVAYLTSGRVSASALIAVVGVLAFAVARVWTDRKYWQAAGGLLMVGVSALLAGSTGRGVDFYLVGVLTSAVGGAVFLVSVLVRWPVVGLVLGAARDDRFGWRRDRARRRRYQRCTAIFLAKFALGTALMVPLYLAGQVVALGIASTLLTTPATGVCAYLSWRILRAEADPAGPGPAVTTPSPG
ncbi:DUF3159 domain-containing protein [Streptosporangium sp. NPDC020145]|uniref:DUF3159 domain-containing protein n=1 Tax=Streptosporangium sp. NPDC020145 TaxID=3154694 RepID=UPI00342AC6AB